MAIPRSPLTPLPGFNCGEVRTTLFYTIVFLCLGISVVSVFIFFQKPEIDFAEECKNVKLAEQSNCWEKGVRELLQKKGLDETLTYMGKLYASNPAFAKECHSLAHVVGQESYLQFAKNGSIEVTPKMLYCAYGTYHGFMEALIQESGDLNKAREFCTFVTQKLSDKVRDPSAIESGCYHGIGHGVTDASDPQTYGNFSLIVEPGLALCAKVGDSSKRIQECATGVFHSLATMEANREHGLTPPANPYTICYGFQSHNNRQACYGQMNTLVLHVTGEDFPRAVSLALSVSNPQNKSTALMNVATAFTTVLLENPHMSDVDAIKVCHTISPLVLRRDCINGLVAGLMQHGEPEKDYIRAQSFCDTRILNPEDRRECLGVLVANVKMRYSMEQTKQICKTLGINNC